MPLTRATDHGQEKSLLYEQRLTVCPRLLRKEICFSNKMAPPRTKKRKSGPETYESEDGFVANDSDTSDRPNKRSKTLKKNTKSPHLASAGGAQLDTDGNEYWEISKMRRVTISEFKGMRMVNIREYYEKDGKDLPGKKVCTAWLRLFTVH